MKKPSVNIMEVIITKAVKDIKKYVNSDQGFGLSQILVDTGKTIAEVAEVFDKRIEHLPLSQAAAEWENFDNRSKYQLLYLEEGKFNLVLLEKFGVDASVFQAAFVAKHERAIYFMSNLPTDHAEYKKAFLTIQSELLSVSKQLNSIKDTGNDLLRAFLSLFEIDFLISVIRHEIANLLVDEEEEIVLRDEDDNENEYDDEDDEEEKSRILKKCGLDSYEEYVDEEEQGLSILSHIQFLIRGNDTLPADLLLTNWWQSHVPSIYEDLRSLLLFMSDHHEISLWDRSNPDYINPETERLLNIEMSKEPDFIALFPRERKDEVGLVPVMAPGEKQRLQRLFLMQHPLLDRMDHFTKQYFEEYGETIAIIVAQSGGDSLTLQTFEELRRAVLNVINFTALHKWVYKQDEPLKLLRSSGVKSLFDETKVLSANVFGSDGIVYQSLEVSRRLVLRLYGWLSLVKIFWKITAVNKRFADLAAVKDDVLVWEEIITVNTLIFQATLGDNNDLCFTIDQLITVCDLINRIGWANDMKTMFYQKAEEYEALQAVEIFNSRIDLLRNRAKNIFLIAEFVLPATQQQKMIVESIKESAVVCCRQYFEFLSLEDATHEKVLHLMKGRFIKANMQFPETEKYSSQLEAYFELMIENYDLPSDVQWNTDFGDPLINSVAHGGRTFA